MIFFFLTNFFPNIKSLGLTIKQHFSTPDKYTYAVKCSNGCTACAALDISIMAPLSDGYRPEDAAANMAEPTRTGSSSADVYTGRPATFAWHCTNSRFRLSPPQTRISRTASDRSLFSIDSMMCLVPYFKAKGKKTL